MSLPWLKIYRTFPGHPKTKALAFELEDHNALAYLVRLWAWCADNAPDGRIKGKHAPATVEDAAGWRGEPGFLFQSLLDIGWLDAVEDGVQVHDWDEYAGAHKEKARRDYEKRKQNRGVNAAESEQKKSRIEAESEQKDGRQVADSANPSLSPSLSQDREVSSKGVQGEFIPAVIEPPQAPSEAWGGDDFWRWAQHKRHEVGFVPEPRPRQEKLNSWWSAVRMVVSDPEAVCEAFYRFGEDPFWQNKKPPLPFNGFMSQWQKYMPQLGGPNARA
jgi:hypothetical protein